MITPPAKFCSVPCIAIPTARPAAPSTAINEVALMPMMSITMMTSITFRSTSTSEARNDFSDGSALRLSSSLIMAFFSSLVSFKPIQSTRMAISSFGTKPTSMSVSVFSPSLSSVFSPVTTSLISVRFIFFRLSFTVCATLSCVSSVWLNSSFGISGIFSFCAAAAAISCGVLSSSSVISYL